MYLLLKWSADKGLEWKETTDIDVASKFPSAAFHWVFIRQNGRFVKEVNF